VLVDARLVGEGVAPHHGLVELHRVAGEAAHHPAGPRQFGDLDADLDVRVLLLPGADRHDDLLHGGVAGPLPDAVDRALHLPGAGLDGGQRVGDGQAQVVVAVGADHVVAGDPFPDRPDALRPLARHGEADRVGDVEGAGTTVDGGLEDVAHEVEVGPGGVLGAELDVVGVLPGTRHRRDGLGPHLLGAHAQLVLHVGGAGGDEHVDAAPLGRLDRLPAAVDVLVGGPGQAADDGAAHRRGDGVDGVEVALAGDREPGLEVVDPQARQLLGDLELLADVQRDARRLFAVAEGGVEDDHPVLRGRCAHGVFLSRWWLVGDAGGGVEPSPKTEEPPGPEAGGSDERVCGRSP
jgi:hypothetical protein